MLEKRFVDPILLLLVLAALLFFTAGCQKPMKKQILSFFFTGIELSEEKKKPEGKKKTEPEAVKAAPQGAEKKRVPPEKILFSHGPYAAGLCNECHEAGPSISAQAAGQDKRNRLPRIKNGLPGMLSAPAELLCTGCHESMSASRAQSARLWLHGPAVQGKCTFCHHPHQSPNPRMLIESPEKGCMQCHEETFSAESREHAESRQCLACHNPHFGKTRFLLKADYEEGAYLIGSGRGSGALRARRNQSEGNGVRRGLSD